MRTRNQHGTCYACPAIGRKRMNPDGKTHAFACAEHVVNRATPHPAGNRHARRKSFSASPGGGQERGRTWKHGPFIEVARMKAAERAAREAAKAKAGE